MNVTSLLAGGLLAWAPCLLMLGAFFAQVWMRRREDGEYLLFSFTTIALGVHVLGLGCRCLLLAMDESDRHLGWTFAVANTGAVASVFTGFHFAYRYGGFGGERRVMGPLYALAACFVALGLSGRWWQAAEHVTRVALLGGTLLTTAPRPSPLASVFYLLCVVSVLFTPVAFGRALVAGRREALPGFVGALLLSATSLNDIWLAVGQRVGVYLSPVGYLFFAFGVSLSLVSRYGRLSTELARQGDDLRARTLELRRSYKQLQKTQAELVRKEQLAVVGELAAVIAHEVRNPLAIIANAVAGLRRAELAADDRTTLLTILDEEASRLNRLVSDLLSYARPVRPQRHQVAIQDVLQRSLTLAATHPHLVVDVAAEPDTPLVWGDPNLLRQVFDNLVGNAVQAMHGDGTLTVRLRPLKVEDQTCVEVAIGDTGEGMDTQVRSRARTPFFTTRPSGTGLGLAIVDRIVDAHGGTMSLQSSSGEGTTVTVLLPQGAESEPPSSPESDGRIGTMT